MEMFWNYRGVTVTQLYEYSRNLKPAELHTLNGILGYVKDISITCKHFLCLSFPCYRTGEVQHQQDH